MRKHYEKIIRDNDNRVKKALRIQVMDEGSPYYGGCPEETGLMDAKYTVYRIYDMAGAYSNSGSLYYRDGGAGGANGSRTRLCGTAAARGRPF